jgi:hypothetical protein
MLVTHPGHCRSADALSADKGETTRRLDESFMHA